LNNSNNNEYFSNLLDSEERESQNSMINPFLNVLKFERFKNIRWSTHEGF